MRLAGIKHLPTASGRSSAGAEQLARWREGYGWWDGEPYREVCRYIDPHGVWQQKERELSAPGTIAPVAATSPAAKAAPGGGGEDYWLRERKIRDEKCAAACGKLPTSYYERQATERRFQAHEISQAAWANQNSKPVAAKPISGQPLTVRAPVVAYSAQALAKTGRYAALHTLSGYAFGRSVILAEELANHAAEAGCPAVAIADPHSLVGCIEFDKACRRAGVKPLIGASVELPEGGEIVLIAQSRTGYRNLSRLITACHLEEPRLFPLATWARLEQYAEGLLCLTGGDVGPLDPLLIQRDFAAAAALVARLQAVYGASRVFLEAERSYQPWTLLVNRLLADLSEQTGARVVAGGVVTHARPEHFPAQDVAACIQTLARVEEPIGRKPLRAETQPAGRPRPVRSLNAERYFHSGPEMAALFTDRPEWLTNTLHVADMVEDSVLPGRTQLPQLFGDDAHALREIVNANAYAVYPQVTPRHTKRLRHEVERIVRLGFATHFLVAGEMCRWAGEQGIHLSGRGSVVDSAVAYVLGFSRIDAIRHNLHFDRFLPDDGSKRPDIDIDFEARRRDDVRGYLIRRFGAERTAVVAAIPSYNTRGIIRGVGKAMGIPDETIGFLAKRIHGGIPADRLEAALEQRPELRDSPVGKEKFRWVMKLAKLLMDVPHDIGCHSSGLCISAEPIRDTVPLMWSGSPASAESQTGEPNLRIMQWDKRSAKHYFDKFDILCLRGQDVLSGTEREIRTQRPEFNAQTVALDDPETYRAMRSGELIGIPQSASPAMRQAHIRLKTNDLHDASLVQAGIRPGVGGAVKINELIARRRGKPYSFLHPDFEEILGLTYGIIVFQEQVDQLLQRFGGYTCGQAEDIRDAIHKRRREDFGVVIKEQLVEKVMANGYNLAVAEAVFEYVSGFKGYGFAQGHALAFAEISLRCIHLMQTEPAAYFAALLSAQPAGYYGSCTIANEARQRGAVILPPSVNRSGLDFKVEDITCPDSGLRIPGGGIRTGLMQLSGVSTQVKATIEACQAQVVMPERVGDLQPMRSVNRSSGRIATLTAPLGYSEPPRAFNSYFDFVRKVEVSRDELEFLILSGALDELCPNRRAMLWAIPAAQHYAAASRADGPNQRLPLEMGEPPLRLEIGDFEPDERAVYERSILGMDIKQHLMAFERPRIEAKAITSEAAKRLKPGTQAVVVGNPIRLRFPPTASGRRVVFFDLEDETGILNVTAFDDVYRRDGKAIVTSPYVTLLGEAQDRDGHIAFLARRVFEYRPVLLKGRNRKLPQAGADFLVG